MHHLGDEGMKIPGMQGQRWYERRYPRVERRAALVIAYVMAIVSVVGVIVSAVSLQATGVLLGLVLLYAMVACVRRLRQQL